MNKKQLEKILKNKLELGKYIEAIDILCEQIEKIYINKVKEHNGAYNYKSINKIAEEVEKYATVRELNLFKAYYLVINEDEHPLYKLEILTDIYNKLKKGDKT